MGWSIAAGEESGSRSTSSDGLRPTDEVSDTSSSIIDSSSEGTVVESVLGTTGVGSVMVMVGGGREVGEQRGIVEAKREGEGGERIFPGEAEEGVFLLTEFLF